VSGTHDASFDTLASLGMTELFFSNGAARFTKGGKMKRKQAGLSLLALLAGAAACAGGPEVPTTVTQSVGDVFLTAPLQPVGTGSTAGGTVRLTDVPGTDNTQIAVQAAGLSAGPHAWHIHSGTCAQPGGVVLAFTTIGSNQGIDDPLVAGANGAASEDAMIPADRLSRAQLQSTPYIVNIHSGSGDRPGGAVACANLR
jgi:hypothetical protein